MYRTIRLLLCAASMVLPALAHAQSPIPEIAYRKFVLPNGLTLIVHEDHKAPIVAVNVWYHVGSKNEKPGKTGFAHLFEHLMFNGSENFNDDYFKAVEPLGATDLNGTTNDGPHELLPERPRSRRSIDPVARVGPHGAPAGRDRPRPDSTSSAASSRTRSARARTSRTAWPRIRSPRTPSRRAPVLLDGDRLDGRPERRVARRREGVVQDVLRAGQRGDRGRGRRQRRRRPASAWRSTSATSPPGPPVVTHRAVGRQAHRRAAQVDAGPRAAGAHLQGLERSRVRRPDQTRPPGPGRRHARRAARPRGSTSASSTTTRSRPTSSRSSTRARSRASFRSWRRPAGRRSGGGRARHGRGARAAVHGEWPHAGGAGAREDADGLAAFIRGVERIGGFGGKSDVLAREHGLPRATRRLQEHLERVSQRDRRRRSRTARSAG